MDDAPGYRGKRVLVTGAASGMGEATARVLDDLGAGVIAVDLRPVSTTAAHTAEIDLRDQASIEAVVDGGFLGALQTGRIDFSRLMPAGS